MPWREYALRSLNLCGIFPKKLRLSGDVRDFFDPQWRDELALIKAPVSSAWQRAGRWCRALGVQREYGAERNGGSGLLKIHHIHRSRAGTDHSSMP